MGEQGILQIMPRPSRYLAAWILLLHLGVFGVVWAWGFDWLVNLSAFALVLMHLVFAIRRRLLRTAPGSLVRLTIDGEGLWNLEYRDGHTTRASLSARSFVSPWLTVLSFDQRLPARCSSLVLLPDSLDGESARRLRIRLRGLNPSASNG